MSREGEKYQSVLRLIDKCLGLKTKISFQNKRIQLSGVNEETLSPVHIQLWSHYSANNNL